MEFEAGRKLSAVHEARWLSMLGYSLRPGYGMALDDWRVGQTRRLLGGLLHNKPTNRARVVDTVAASRRRFACRPATFAG